MVVPERLFQKVEIRWQIPEEITSANFDTINIYRSGNEASQYVLLTSIPFIGTDGNPQTSYVDTSTDIGAKDVTSYVISFSNSTTGEVSQTYLAYKALTPREQRIIYQLRDYLSRFITNRLADEELRQYLEQGLNAFNVYTPQTSFTIFSLPQKLEPLVILGAVIFGVAYNLLGIGFTDINYSDQGWSLTTSRMDKMSQTMDKVTKMYNDLLAIAKLDYAPGPEGVGTVSLPIGMAGNYGRNILSIFDLLNSLGR